jgi:hypothetical protein
MPYLSMKELGLVAANLGHTNLRVVPMRAPGWFRAECGCGYRSARRNTVALAAEAAGHHAVKAATEFVNRARGNGHDISEYLTPHDDPADISDTPASPGPEMFAASA